MGKSNKEFTDWRQAEADKMPALAARVFALRNKMYTGCGFHWGMERDLGVIIARLNDYDTDYYHGTEALARQIGLEVHLEQLYKHVEQAEKSAEEWEREKKRKDPKKTKYILTSEGTEKLR
jgi:hypothetical protein